MRTAVVLTALATFAALVATLTPDEPSVDAHAVADAVLAVAKTAPAGPALADEVGRVLPRGGRAVVVRPGWGGEAPGRHGTHRVAVVVGEVDRAAVALLVADGGVVGSSAAEEGWWVAVSVPGSGSAPVVPALALLVAAVLLGAAAGSVGRGSAAPGRAGRDSPG
ncbi:hypothetical protein [Saccharothrix sp. HUAS TT1]|uniref:hypothetical protein n=1 Tax=unclassified Saccharothrix TaxID=2593673 RepID=UPI00345B90EE